MEKELIAKTTVTINAPIHKVWEALIKPELIKQYFFGTDAVSDWKIGSKIIFRGTWEGKPYEDVGIIKKMEPPSLFQFAYRSSFSEGPDTPENYAMITYRLTSENNATVLAATQDKNESEEKKKHNEENWGIVFNNLKVLLEK